MIKKNIYKIKIGTTKYGRIKRYLKSLDENIKINSKIDQMQKNQINEIIDEKIKHIKRMNKILIIFYVGIYFSFISMFFNNWLIIGEITNIIKYILSFFGTTFFIIGSVITNKILELYYQDLNLLTSHLISIYEKNTKSLNEVLEEKNSLSPFIEFFKSRGFN